MGIGNALLVGGAVRGAVSALSVLQGQARVAATGVGGAVARNLSSRADVAVKDATRSLDSSVQSLEKTIRSIEIDPKAYTLDVDLYKSWYRPFFDPATDPRTFQASYATFRKLYLEQFEKTYSVTDVKLNLGQGKGIDFPFSYHVFKPDNVSRMKPPVVILPFLAGSARNISPVLVNFLLAQNHSVVLPNYPTVGLPNGALSAGDKRYWDQYDFDVIIACLGKLLTHIYFEHDLAPPQAARSSVSTPSYRVIANSVGGLCAQRLLVHSHLARTDLFEYKEQQDVLLGHSPSLADLKDAGHLSPLDISSILLYGCAFGYPVEGGYISPKLKTQSIKTPKEETAFVKKVDRQIESLRILENTVGDLGGRLRAYDGSALELPILLSRILLSKFIAKAGGGFPLSLNNRELKEHMNECVLYDPALYGSKVLMSSIDRTIEVDPAAGQTAHATAYAIAAVGHLTRTDVVIAKGGDFIFSAPLPLSQHADLVLKEPASKRIFSSLTQYHLSKRLPHYMNDRVTPLIANVFKGTAKEISGSAYNPMASVYREAYDTSRFSDLASKPS